MNREPLDQERPHAGQPQSVRPRFGEILLIVLLFFCLTGDPPPNVNEAHYLCRLKHFWNPQWAAGDLFLESKDAQVVFVWAFGWITRWLSLSATAWVGRILAWTLLAWAWQRLSWRIIPRPWASVLSAALFVTLTEHLNLAGEWIVGGVEAKCFAYVCVLIALCDIIDRRWNRAWIALGAATALHPIVGGWSGLLCAAIWLVNDRQAVPLRSMAPALALGALLSLPGIFPALLLTTGVPPDVVAEANRIYVFERLPHHLAPLSLPASETGRRIGGHAALLIVFVALWCAGRGAEFARPLRRIAQFAWGALLLAAIGFAIELALWNDPTVAARVLRYYWFRITDFSLPTATALYATAWAVDALKRRRNWAPLALAALLIVAGWNIVHATRERVLQPLPPADRKLRDFNAWVEACDWAAENTPANALFLTPRLNLSFKWRAGRPEVANRKDLPQDARSIVEWHARIQDIYYAVIDGAEMPLDSLGVLGTERVRELATKYGAQYVLMDRGQLLSLPAVYRNQEYIIYRIDGANAPHAR